MSIADIAIVSAPRSLQEETPSIKALLSELTQHIEHLLDTGESTSIDLRALLSQVEVERLKNILGQGEVQATMQAFGPSHIHETSIPGVWYIEHRNTEDEPMTALLMVTVFPDILSTPVESLNESRSLLAELLTKTEGE